MILREAFVLAAQKAGGGGPDGVVNYLAEKALTHPAAFLSGLARVIPLEVNAKGNGHITIEIVKSVDDVLAETKLINGRANGHTNGNGHEDPAAE